MDVVARHGTDLVVVEVKTVTGPGRRPLERIDVDKARRLWTMARSVGARRVEYVGIRVSASGIAVEWLPG